MEGHTGSSTACAFLLCMLCGFRGQIFLFRYYGVSVLDAIPSCVMALLSTKQGGSFAFHLMPVHEETVFGPGPVFSASVLTS